MDFRYIFMRLVWFIFGFNLRITLYEEMSRLFGSVTSVQVALTMLYDTYANKIVDASGHVVYKKAGHPIAYIINRMRQAVEEGNSFSEGFRGFVPDLEIEILNAGDTSGRLGNACDDLVLMLRGRMASRIALLGLAYPVFILFVIVILLQQLYRKMIPMLSGLYPVDQWSDYAKVMYSSSKFANDYFLLIILIIVCLIALYGYSLSRLTGKVRVFLDRFPPYSIYRLWVGVGLLFTISALHRARVPIKNILNSLLVHASPYLRERLNPTLFYYTEGDNLGEAFERTETGFPDHAIIRHLKMFAEMKGYDEAIRSVAEDWLGRSVRVLQKQVKVMIMASLLAITMVICIIIIGFYQVQNQAGMHLMMMSQKMH